MRQSYNDSYSSRDRSRRKRNIIIVVLSVLSVTLILGATLGWHYRKGKNKDSANVPDKPKIPFCSDIPDKKRFDCYPDADANSPINETECINRGCCFSAPKFSAHSTLTLLNVPYCYYPSNYVGYAIKEKEEIDGQLHSIKLQRVRQSGFIKDVQNVDVLVSYIDDNSLRIKIIDADSQRYEVPLKLYYQTKELVKPLYSVSLDSDTGLFTISRISTGSVIFKTNLFRLVYSDQFIQLSSDLPSPYIYGIGEHYEGVLRSVNWTKLTLLNSDLGPIPNHALYGSHPFYMALDAAGKASGVFLFNSNIMDVLLQPAPAITFRPIGGILDFYIMMGPSPNDVSRQFSNIVGKTFMPPFWSLGFHLCRYGYNSLNKTNETMQRNIDVGIPLDVQWNDIDYMDKYRDFTYDKNNFDGLPQFVDDLHSKGMHYIIMIDPAISNSEKSYIPYKEGLDDDIFVKNASGSILVGEVWPGETVYPDFSHPDSTFYWARQLERFYDEIKYDGVWIDMNEPSNFENGALGGCPKSSLENPQYIPGGNLLSTKTLCMTAKHYSGIHYNEHNLYPYREAVATNKALKYIRKKRPFIISRASFSGQGVFSGHWSGDIRSSWEDMRYSIRSMINFNMYAMPMIGSDICGFGGNVTVDLCARWQALGAFYPFSRNHNERDTIEQDPFALGEKVVEATRTALLKRYNLLPYLYTLFYRSHVFGDTVIRPLFFEFPEDKNTYGIDEQFLWGSNLLIAQVLYPNISSVDVYFPKGIWYDAVDGHQNESHGETVKLTISDTNIYIGVMGGIIVPALAAATTTTELRKNPFTLAVALDKQKEAFGELYWDDGDSLETYDKGEYSLIEFQAANGNLTNTITSKNYEDGMYLQGVNVIGYGELPTNVTINNRQCNFTSYEIPKNSSVDEVSSLLSDKFLGVGIANHNVTDIDDSCIFFQIANILMIQTNPPVSLLSPLSVTWK